MPTWMQLKANESELSARWGHCCVRIRRDLVTYGGYQGKYSAETHILQTESFTWRIIYCIGQLPGKRSNYTMHYCEAKEELILFGGGNQLTKFNSIHVLHWPTKEWRLIKTQINVLLPPKRNYHVSELLYPYLVIQGGEDMTGKDLDDCWVFNFSTLIWSEVKVSQDLRMERRFHSSALVRDKMYIFGGCRGQYQCIGDALALDLAGLVQNGSVEQLSWKVVIEDNPALMKWGHSSDVFQDKVYILGGRDSLDIGYLFVFDPTTNSLQTKGLFGFEPRRRHGSCFMGCCLVTHGGFNGNFLCDLKYLNVLDLQPLRLNPEKFQDEIMELFCQVSPLLMIHDGQVTNLVIKLDPLESNYFTSYQKYNREQNITFSLPNFMDTNTFLLLVSYKNKGQLPLVNLSLNKTLELLEAAEYLCLNDPKFLHIIEMHLRHFDMDTRIFEASVRCKIEGISRKYAREYLMMEEGEATRLFQGNTSALEKINQIEELEWFQISSHKLLQQDNREEQQQFTPRKPIYVKRILNKIVGKMRNICLHFQRKKIILSEENN